MTELALPTRASIETLARTKALAERQQEVAVIAAALRERCTSKQEADDLRREVKALIAVFAAKRVKTEELESEERRIEVRIGELLGPPMTREQTGSAGRSSTDDDLKLHNEHIHTFRLMAEHHDVVERELERGHTTRKHILRAIRDEADAEALAAESLPAHQILLSACSELATHVAAESVDVIVTDPPYPEKYLDAYSDLSHFAAHALKEGGLCVALAGQSWLPQVLTNLASALDYHWLGCYLTPGGQASGNRGRGVNAGWKPICIFRKGKYAGRQFGDVVRSEVNDNDAGLNHPWGQSESGTRDLVLRFSDADDLVVDPFVGSGTVGRMALAHGRRFIGADIDAEAVEQARSRIGG